MISPSSISISCTSLGSPCSPPKCTISGLEAASPRPVPDVAASLPAPGLVLPLKPSSLPPSPLCILLGYVRNLLPDWSAGASVGDWPRERVSLEVPLPRLPLLVLLGSWGGGWSGAVLASSLSLRLGLGVASVPDPVLEGPGVGAGVALFPEGSDGARGVGGTSAAGG